MPILLQLAQSYSNPDSVNYKLAYLREQMEQGLLNLGDLAYEDQVQLAMLGDTIIIGGFLRTELIAAKSILAEHLNVDSLSAISANIGEVTSGTLTGTTIRTSAGSDRIELSNNLLRSYLNGIRRVQLDYDSLDFWTANNRAAGTITSVDMPDYGDGVTDLVVRNNNGFVSLISGTDNDMASISVNKELPDYGGISC